MNVYEAIAAVQSDLVKEGIAKDRKNTQQGYAFRGIDDVYNALSPLLAKHALCILPRMVARSCTERESKNGGVLFSVVVEAEFDFVSAKDGTRHTVKTYGEAMDSADKATNKAMSAAYKYAAFQAFCVPTEGDNDADAHTHEVAAKAPAPRPEPRLVRDEAPAPAKPHSTKGFAAKFDGRNPCPRCGGALRKGELVQFVAQGSKEVQHVECRNTDEAYMNSVTEADIPF